MWLPRPRRFAPSTARTSAGTNCRRFSPTEVACAIRARSPSAGSHSFQPSSRIACKKASDRRRVSRCVCTRSSPPNPTACLISYFTNWCWSTTVISRRRMMRRHSAPAFSASRAMNTTNRSARWPTNFPATRRPVHSESRAASDRVRLAKVLLTAKQPAFAAALVLLELLCAGCRRKAELSPGEQPPVARVRVQAVASRKHLATEEVVGTVRAKLHAAIEAKVSGRIERMLLAPGQVVKAGDLLAQLDAREIQARLDQALALRDQYGRDTDRLRSLAAQKSVSRQEFETVESHYRVAMATVAEIETMLGYTRIVAPFDGIVTRKLADVGDLASPGRTLLEIDDLKALRLEADVPEALIKCVQLGAKLEVRVTAQDAPIPSVVSEVAPVADPASRTFMVKLDLPASTDVRAGQFARVSVPVGEEQALRVPTSAVVQRGQMELAFVVVNSQAQLRLVKTGKRLGDEVEIVSGVSAGEQVIVDGSGQLRDGQPVEVTP